MTASPDEDMSWEVGIIMPIFFLMKEKWMSGTE
jgi:hypothetical protein